jgi:hypothetical protein
MIKSFNTYFFTPKHSHMTGIFKKLLGGLSLCGIVMTAHAQEFQDYLSKYTEENGMGYMQPFADAFGANINTGWFHSADIKKRRPQIYIGMVGMMALVPKSKKTFIATPEGLFIPKIPSAVPTVFGKGESVTIESDAGTSYTFPGGLNVQGATLAAPQVNIGSFFGTQASARFLIYNLGGEIGKLNMYGVGLRHSISQYIPSSPVQLAAGYYWTTCKVGDVANAQNSFISLQGSYPMKKLSFYGGLGYEITTMQVRYTFEWEEGSEEDIHFDLEGSNRIRLTLGVSLQLGPLRLNTDYNLSDQSVFSLGIGFDIEKKQ